MFYPSDSESIHSSTFPCFRLGELIRMSDDSQETPMGESLLAGTIAMALCHIARVIILFYS